MNSRARNHVEPQESANFFYKWLLLSLFVEYARPASYFSFLAIPFLYSIIPIGLLVVSSFAKGMRPWGEIFADPLAKWVLIFFGLITFSAVHADVTEYVFKVWKAVLGYVMIFIMVARIATSYRRMRGIFIVLMIAHLFLLAMNPVVVTDPNNRHYIIGATFLGDGNDYSLSLCILFPFAIEVALSQKSLLMRIAAWGGLGILTLAIIGTQSRGATLGMGAVLIFLWLLSTKKMASLVGVAVVGLIVMVYAPPAYFQRMGSIADYQNEGSAQGRIEAWKGGTNMALRYPLTGVGAGQFPTSFGTKFRTPGSIGMPWLTAHSSYFLVLGELGFPGLLAVLILVLGNMRNNLRRRSEVLARAGPTPSEQAKEDARMLYLTCGGMLGFAVAGAFLSAAYYPHLFVLTGLLISARNIAAKNAGIPLREATKGRGRRQQAAESTPEAPVAATESTPSVAEPTPRPWKSSRARPR